MKIVIDYDLCEANAVCMDVCPECFRVEEQRAREPGHRHERRDEDDRLQRGSGLCGALHHPLNNSS